ncbi:glycosyltransferase family 2 protein [Kineosporia succinea]|uniref:GT2 family glycosyltransferase n=1 Tax=Kineosporia succinea TaxID=84632 RepID=A0ABT9PEN5_9ACTN|nr:glycosyltransferase [Kineosporia succinea]MDP9830942.1 GT2 family glycosyltransferase [Kineosporia succinea]
MSNAAPPSVTVVIACRNAADTLWLQLEALTRQSYAGAWEVVISDNGSTDGSRTVAECFRGRLPGLRIIDSSSRPGAGPARNAAVAVARYDHLAFCDADDEVTPTWLAALGQALTVNSFVAGRFEPSKLNSPRAYRSRPLQQNSGLQESPFGPGLPHAGAGNLAVRRDVFEAVGGFDAEVGTLEDTDLCWRIQLAGTPLVFEPQAIVHVRLRSSVAPVWRQAWAYGRASALLRTRYGNVSEGSGDPVSLPVRLLRLLGQARRPEALVWVLAWHLGHRSLGPQEGLTALPAAARPSGPRR